jgi:hypothetical protein
MELPSATGGDSSLLCGGDVDVDGAASVVKRRKFNKVDSLRMMVSGTPEQQAARQVFESEKQLQKFLSSPRGAGASPRLPK